MKALTRLKVLTGLKAPWGLSARRALKPLGRFLAVIVLFASDGVSTVSYAEESRCYGTPARGRLVGGVSLPTSGKNFTVYSALGASLGRTYAHAKVVQIVLDAYARLAIEDPHARFVYGETGLATGGAFSPHRTHQNGLSVDFFVPVRDEAGQPAILPSHALNQWGYAIAFDAKARYGTFEIDFERLAAHLLALDEAARARNVRIERVIFDQAYLPRLFASQAGKVLQKRLTFMKAKPWIRHDEHYHVDFSLPCLPY